MTDAMTTTMNSVCVRTPMLLRRWRPAWRPGMTPSVVSRMAWADDALRSPMVAAATVRRRSTWRCIVETRRIQVHVIVIIQ